MSVYRDVCEKMKLNFGIQTNEKKNSVLLNSMIELLLMSPPRPLLTMLSTSVLILRMLRSKTKKKKLYTMLSTENIRQIRDGHATVAVRILAIVRHWHCTRKKNALIFVNVVKKITTHNSPFLLYRYVEKKLSTRVISLIWKKIEPSFEHVVVTCFLFWRNSTVQWQNLHHLCD